MSVRGTYVLSGTSSMSGLFHVISTELQYQAVVHRPEVPSSFDATRSPGFLTTAAIDCFACRDPPPHDDDGYHTSGKALRAMRKNVTYWPKRPAERIGRAFLCHYFFLELACCNTTRVVLSFNRSARRIAIVLRVVAIEGPWSLDNVVLAW